MCCLAKWDMVFDMGGVDFNLPGAQPKLLTGLVNCSTRTGELKQETFFFGVRLQISCRVVLLTPFYIKLHDPFDGPVN